MKPLVIYHKNCRDGFGAALAARVWARYEGIELEYLPALYGDPVPDVSGREVCIVDFSYPREVLLEMKAKAKSLIVLDHHKTAEQDLQGLDFCLFDMNRSGAVITWEHLLTYINVPDLFLYIQDRDLWQWKLPHSKEVSAGLELLDMSFDTWEEYLDNKMIPDLINTGKTILQYQTKCIEAAIKQAYPMELAGYTVPCINTTHLVSEIGNELAKGHPFAVMYFDTADKRVYSLRSAEDGIDVSEIAKKFGGGGHKHAAGFTLPKYQEIFYTIAQT